MARKIVYKLVSSTKRSAAGTDADDDLSSTSANLPKRTRTLLLNLQLAEEEKDYVKQDHILETLGDLYQESEDIGQTVIIGKKELALANKFQDQKDARTIKTRGHARLAKCYRKLEKYDAAIAHNEQYLTGAQFLRDPLDEIEAHSELALTHLARFESSDTPDPASPTIQLALQSLGAAAGLIKSAPKNRREAIKADLHLNIGIAFLHAAQTKKAATHIGRAAAVYQKEGNRPFEAKAYTNFALCALQAGDAAQCLEYMGRERQIWADLGDAAEEARACWDLHVRCREFHRWLEAKEALKAHALLCADVDDIEGRRKGQAAMREVDECLEKEKTVASITEQLVQIRRLPDAAASRRLFDALAERGRLLLDLENFGPALLDFSEQKRIAYALDLPKHRIELVLRNIGDANLGIKGGATEAARAYNEALDRFAGDEVDRLDLLLRLAEAYAQEKDSVPYETVQRTCEEALTLAKKLADAEATREVLQVLIALNRTHHFEAKVAVYSEQLNQANALAAAQRDSSETQGSSILDEDLSADENDENEQADLPDMHPPSPTPARRRPQPLLSPSRAPLRQLAPIANARDRGQEDVTDHPLPHKARTSKYTVHLIDDDLDVAPSPPVRWQPTQSRAPPTRPRTPPRPSVVIISSPPEVRTTQMRATARKRLRIESSPDPPSPQRETSPTPNRRKVPSPPPPQAAAAINRNSLSPAPPPVESQTPTPPQPPPLAQQSFSTVAAGGTPLPAATPQPTPTSTKSRPRSSARSVRSATITTPPQTARRTSRLPHKIRVVFPAPLTTPAEEADAAGCSTPKRHPQQTGDEIFAIACPDGPRGTPKTIGWLVHEAQRRYGQIYRVKPPILKLVTTDPDTAEQETLGTDDIITDVLANKQKVIVVLREPCF
ncbi:hypothetical protein HDU87_001261 [Geranomyces variabilis]|uniref:Uncharacterized protein n=1 Tax=Geranomyces variabilis TaxID=109894 RepID=A0AAD5TB87_9FUNG|nr:hypothetical protein HDU87_001261 [Geranomyces variabilis]